MAQLTYISLHFKMVILGMANIGKIYLFNSMQIQYAKQTILFQQKIAHFALLIQIKQQFKVSDPKFKYLCQIFKLKSQIISTL
ncbi:unnamed protein product [Paramecium sonneborni]|uniref:Transmembrane protein n=1 Tax=Paramecium sonneborni TaxID=65129 RepID=A0A8S1NTX4_9CILI|nr:unnamed protein product [Paramecium sonneborni]